MAHRMSNLKMLTYLLCLTAILFLREPKSGMESENILQQQDANSCDCGKCLSENDTWFMQHFNQSIQPYLSAKYNLSEDDFNWWKRLQGEKSNFSTYRETVKMLFQIFPPSPDVLEPRLQQCKTCAVVGNSVNLKGSHYGPLIDTHDVVIRINYGQTKGYEEDAGNRTTHRVMYPESATKMDSTTRLVFFPFKLRDLKWLIRGFTTDFPGMSYNSAKKMNTANKNLVTVLNPAFMRYVHQTWLDKKGSYPSTGIMALVLALHICGEVDVFGYGADKDGNWSHYWEKLRNKALKTGGHPGIHEYKMIQKLDRKQKIKFYSGQ